MLIHVKRGLLHRIHHNNRKSKYNVDVGSILIFQLLFFVFLLRFMFISFELIEIQIETDIKYNPKKKKLKQN